MEHGRVYKNRTPIHNRVHVLDQPEHHRTQYFERLLSGTIIRGTLKAPNSQLVTPISTKLQRPDGCD
jgi:hypothetical protein